MITGNADAEFGNVNGGEVVMVTRGGTNDAPRQLFLLHTGGGLTANSWGNKYSGTPRPGYTQNQFGAAVGGPLSRTSFSSSPTTKGSAITSIWA